MTVWIRFCALALALCLALPLNVRALETEQDEPLSQAELTQDPEALPETEAPEEEAPEETQAPEEPEQSQEEQQEQPAPDSEEPEENAVPLYFQTDYPDVRYGPGTVASNGCGITSLAMVATYLTGHEYSPEELAGYFGGYGENNIQRLEYASDELQLPWVKAGDFWDAMDALEQGKVVIALMNSNSIFTSSQHFIVLTGLNEEGKILVNDPYEPNYDHWQLKNAFVSGFSQGDLLCGFSGAWIYDPAAMPETPYIYVDSRVAVETRYPGVALSDEELELLAGLIWLEARGESAQGQQAVAEVILNRLVSENFPDTLAGVIYAEDQFRSIDSLDTAEPGQAQYDAIENALHYQAVLPIEVVHFATYPVNQNVWGRIGGHVFCYDADYEAAD